MRKPSHINKLVNCKLCPLTYCLDCRPDGCKCGGTAYTTDHNDIKGEGSVITGIYRSREEIQEAYPRDVTRINNNAFTGFDTLPTAHTNARDWGSIVGSIGNGGQNATTAIIDPGSPNEESVNTSGIQLFDANRPIEMGTVSPRERRTARGIRTRNSIRPDTLIVPGSMMETAREITTSLNSETILREIDQLRRNNGFRVGGQSFTDEDAHEVS